mgnify:CR=1 FL=1|tara:strand:+ start:942 stop:1409 length:468 start_codon:yes stop_codon:yes gene_type:complete
MATNDLIQKLPAKGEDPLTSETMSHRRTVETFIAGGTIAIGDVVAWEDSKTGAEAAYTVEAAGAVATGNPLACGVAITAATAGQRVDVVTAGYVAKAKAGTIAGTGSLVGAIGAAEVGTMPVQATSGTVAWQSVFGVTLKSKVGNFVEMMVYRRF